MSPETPDTPTPTPPTPAVERVARAIKGVGVLGTWTGMAEAALAAISCEGERDHALHGQIVGLDFEAVADGVVVHVHIPSPVPALGKWPVELRYDAPIRREYSMKRYWVCEQDQFNLSGKVIADKREDAEEIAAKLTAENPDKRYGVWEFVG